MAEKPRKNNNQNDKLVFSREWIPKISVGSFLFGTSDARNLIENGLKILPEEYDEDVDWEVYGYKHDIRAYIDKGKLVSLTINDSFKFKNTEVIGKTIDQISMLLEVDEFLFKDDGIISVDQKDINVYSVDSLGLQVWVSHEIIESVSCF